MGKKVVYIDGVFDLFHSGHLEYLELARLAGDVLIIGVKPDKMVREIKGLDRPRRPQLERQLVLAGFEAADFVFISPGMENKTYAEWRSFILATLNPSIYAIMDQDEQLDEKKKCVALIDGIELQLLTGTPKTQSTTAIIDKGMSI